MKHFDILLLQPVACNDSTITKLVITARHLRTHDGLYQFWNNTDELVCSIPANSCILLNSDIVK